MDGQEAEDQARSLVEGREGVSSATQQSPDLRGGVTVGPSLTLSRLRSRVLRTLLDLFRP